MGRNGLRKEPHCKAKTDVEAPLSFPVSPLQGKLNLSEKRAEQVVKMKQTTFMTMSEAVCHQIRLYVISTSNRWILDPLACVLGESPQLEMEFRKTSMR
jgi:hypothetical protein